MGGESGSAGTGVPVRVTATTSAGAYGANEQVGAKLQFKHAVSHDSDDPGSGLIHGLQIVDPSKTAAGLILLLFSEDFTESADNGAFSMVAADKDKFIGSIEVETTDYVTTDDHSLADVGAISKAFAVAGTDIYGLLLAKATPTFGAAVDLRVTLRVIRD